MSGPFSTETEARESVRHIINPAAYDSETQANRALLKAAVTLAGVELGAYDKQIVDLVTDWDVATVAVIAGLIMRADASGGRELVLGQALADAIAWRRAMFGEDGSSEQRGLYASAARALRIPGDVTQSPAAWHPDCVVVRPSGAVLTAGQRGMVLAALADATEGIRDRAAHCGECEASPADLCEGCAARLLRAAEYDQLAAEIGGVR